MHLPVAPLASASFGTFLAETRKVRKTQQNDKLKFEQQLRIGRAQRCFENHRPTRHEIARRGVAERSESEITMIAGGNHTIIHSPQTEI